MACQHSQAISKDVAKVFTYVAQSLYFVLHFRKRLFVGDVMQYVSYRYTTCYYTQFEDTKSTDATVSPN